MFGAAFPPEKSVSSLLHQLNSNGSPCVFYYFPSTLSTLQFSKNIRMLISLPRGCVCENVLFFLHVSTQERICLCVCACIQVQKDACCVCAKVSALSYDIQMLPWCFHMREILKAPPQPLLPASPTVPAYIDWELGLIIRRGGIPFRTANSNPSIAFPATLPLHEAWYLMHMCGGWRWWTGGKVEVDVPLAKCKAVKPDPTSVRHIPWGETGRGGGRKVRALRKSGEECEGEVAEDEDVLPELFSL